PFVAMPAREPDIELALPVSDPPAAPIPPRTDVLRFRCACGSDFQARPEHAGQPTRCLRCGEILFIPSRQKMRQADGRPVLAALDCENRYQPRREPGSWAGVLLVLILLLLMGGGGYAYWTFYARDQVAREQKAAVEKEADRIKKQKQNQRRQPGMGP